MKRSNFNIKFREYARTLSPTSEKQILVNAIYQSFNDLFGDTNCIQIGSYPRYTSIMPIHDLDILYVLGEWADSNHNPLATLQNLFKKVRSEYVNPTKYQIKVSLQTHSVTVLYLNNEEEIFSVDIVPAYIFEENEFKQDAYKVPEIIKETSHRKRKDIYFKLQENHIEMSWINSDPRGYIKVASDVGKNTDFRKTVKLIKRWKNNLCEQDSDLKLKSFHLEQVVTKLFQNNKNIDIFDAIFAFFYNLYDVVNSPNQIADRANNNKYIDDYVEKFTPEQRLKINQARDGFLVKLEAFSDDDSVKDLMVIDFYERDKSKENFLFDQQIPVLKDDVLTINTWIQKNERDERRLNAMGIIDNGYYLRFEVSSPISTDYYKWKVKNDNNSPQPRGEITDHQTKNNLEHTKYKGKHYVECFAIRNNTCIASARQNVILR